MPLRAIIASFIALGALAVGAYFISEYTGAGLDEFVSLLLGRTPQAGVLCIGAAWGALASGVLTTLAAAAAFADEPDPDSRRRRDASASLVLFAALALGLFWFALHCLRAETLQTHAPHAPYRSEAPAAALLTAEPEPEPEPEPRIAEPSLPPAPEPDPLSEPRIEAYAAALQWEFMRPLITEDGRFVRSPSMERKLKAFFGEAGADSRTRRTLCEAAWIAFAGAASEEGPSERNERRAAVRAELSIVEAQTWLHTAPDECGRPVLLGIDLGQHASTGADDPAQTAYQRQLLIVARLRAGPDDSPAPETALAELQTLLEDQDFVAVFVDGRRYRRAPRPFLP